MADPRGQDASFDSRSLLRSAITTLQNAGVPDPGLDAELLLAAAANLSRTQLLTSPPALDDTQSARFETMLASRAARVPLPYILGYREFYSLEFEVNSEVLIPRPETETLVAAALAFIGDRRAVRILDLGTGSGAIAIALAVHAPSAILVATDLSRPALAIACRNADRLGVTPQIAFVLGDCWSPLLPHDPLGRFDLIVSNPPYIGEAELATLEPEVRDHEPRIALTPGPDPLSFYRRIATGLTDHLASDGALMVELGYGQAQAVGELLREAGRGAITLIDDLSGIPRVLQAC